MSLQNLKQIKCLTCMYFCHQKRTLLISPIEKKTIEREAGSQEVNLKQPGGRFSFECYFSYIQTCPFLASNEKGGEYCRLQSHRPLACQIQPLWLRLLSGRTFYPAILCCEEIPLNMARPWMDYITIIQASTFETYASLFNQMSKFTILVPNFNQPIHVFQTQIDKLRRK